MQVQVDTQVAVEVAVLESLISTTHNPRRRRNAERKLALLRRKAVAGAVLGTLPVRD